MLSFTKREVYEPRQCVFIGTTKLNWEKEAVLGLQVIRDSSGRLTLALNLPDLLHGLWYLFALHACNGTQLRQCEHCGTPYMIGTGQNTHGD